MKRKLIDSETLKNWRLKSFETTQTEIQEYTGLSLPTIRMAVNTGIATKETITKLNKFFDTLQIA